MGCDKALLDDATHPKVIRRSNEDADRVIKQAQPEVEPIINARLRLDPPAD